MIDRTPIRTSYERALNAEASRADPPFWTAAEHLQAEPHEGAGLIGLVVGAFASAPAWVIITLAVERLL